MNNYVRKPFLILPYTKKNIAVPKELMMDFDTGKMYVRSKDGLKDIEIGSDIIINIITDELENIKDMVSEDGDTLRKLRELIRELEIWKDTMESSNNNNIIDILSEILDKFANMSEDTPTLKEQLLNKVDKVVGKGLSTNDLTDVILQKLTGIEDYANKYIHPISKQCNYKAPVDAVNNRTGDVVITKDELGLGNVDPNANKYIHPYTKQCNVVGISSINNKTGSVLLNKSNIKLENVQNYKIANKEEALSGESNKYLTPLRAKQIIDNIKESSGAKMKKYNVIYSTSADIKIRTLIDGSWIESNNISVYPGVYSFYAISNNNKLYTGSALVSNSDTYINIDESYFIGVVQQVYSSRRESTIFVLTDGTVKGAGRNSSGQLGIGNREDYQNTPVTIPITNIKQASGGAFYTMFLSNDGTVRGAGANYSGQFGTGDTGVEVNPKKSLISNVKQIACGDGNFTIFLLNDGTVKGAGTNNKGQLGIGVTGNKLNPVGIPINNVKQVACGAHLSYTMFLLNDGTVKGVGDNSSGQLGIGNTIDQSSIVDVPINNVKQISCGGKHTLFLLEDGTVKGCGRNFERQLGVPDGNDQINIQNVPISNVKHIECGAYYSMFLMNDNTVKGVGANSKNQIGVDDYLYVLDIKTVPITNVRSISAGYYETIFLTTNNDAKGVGYNYYGSLGVGHVGKVSAITDIPL